MTAKSRTRREVAARLAAPSGAPRALRNDVLPTLHLVYTRVDDLRSQSRKVRKLEPDHVRDVAATIGALGFCAPVLIGKDNVVIDGEVRIEAAKLLGLETAPCVRVDHLSNEEQRLLRLAVNRLGEKGQWDLDALKIEFGELIVADAPIEIAGFTMDEIDQVVHGDMQSAIEAGPLAPSAAAIAVARPGDVFLLGPHKLVCGDATNLEMWRSLMDGDSDVQLLLTDVPFNVKIKGHVSGSGHREFAMASGEMSDEEFSAFNVGWIEAPNPYLAEGAVAGSFIDWRGYPIVHAAFVQAKLTALNLIVWGKTNAGTGSLYRSPHELLPLFKKGSTAHVNNIELGKRGRSNLWTYPGASSLGSDARRGLQDHPTVKPVAMLEDALLDLTRRGDVVLGPFLGSGSTLMACEKTGRVCRGLELDPLYVDVIVRRFAAATGTPAVLAETGERFVDLSARRLRESAEDSGTSMRASASAGGALSQTTAAAATNNTVLGARLR